MSVFLTYLLVYPICVPTRLVLVYAQKVSDRHFDSNCLVMFLTLYTSIF